jgi:hypothetical protein
LTRPRSASTSVLARTRRRARSAEQRGGDAHQRQDHRDKEPREAAERVPQTRIRSKQPQPDERDHDEERDANPESRPTLVRLIRRDGDDQADHEQSEHANEKQTREHAKRLAREGFRDESPTADPRTATTRCVAPAWIRPSVECCLSRKRQPTDNEESGYPSAWRRNGGVERRIRVGRELPERRRVD